MIHKEQSHEFTCLFYIKSQHIISFAWMATIRRMIMSHCYYCSIIQYRFLYDNPNINSSFTNTANTNCNVFDKIKRLIHQ